MPGKSGIIAIDVDPERLGVAEAAVKGRGVVITAWRSFERPRSVDIGDAGAVGRWLRVELDRAGVRATRVMMAMPRGDVVLKKLSLPGPGGPDDPEIGGMVRLQMARQLTMAPASAAVDYTQPTVENPSAEAPSADGGGSAVSVMAGAMPGDRVDWCRGVCAAAGLKLRRIALRCYGVAGLLADLSQRKAGALLGVCPGASSVEFVVVEDGQLTFARAVDAPRAQGEAETAGYAERLAVEAKRTWMSHRSSRGGGEAELVIALGSDDAARALAQQCGAQLERPWELARMPGAVRLETGVPGEDAPALYALSGLLLEELGDRTSLDFANPRRAPDPAAARRRNVLAGALGVILLAGGSYIAAQRSIAALDERLDEARVRQAELRARLDELHAQHARLSHLDQWKKIRVDWVSYLGMLHEQVPPPDQAILDGITGKLTDADVAFTLKTSKYQDGSWGVRQLATISMDGKAGGRSAAADLRGRLLGLGFDAVESRGPDVPDRFQFTLTTSQPEPVKPRPPEAPQAGAEAAKSSDGAAKGGSS